MNKQDSDYEIIDEDAETSFENNFINVNVTQSLDRIREEIKLNENISMHNTIKPNKFYSLIKSIFSIFEIVFKNFISKFLIGIILSFFWIYFYILSLEGCEKDQAECLKNLNKDFAIKMGKLIFASSFFLIILILFIVMKFTYKIFIYSALLSMLYLFYFYDTGSDFAHHGSYNRLFFIIFFCVQILTISFIYLLLRTVLIHPTKTIFLIAALLYILYFHIYDLLHNSCEYWDKGFKDSLITNDGINCNINKPTGYCFLKVTSDWFDISSLKNINCRMDRNLFEEQNLLKKYLPKEKDLNKSKRLGFPRTEKWKFFPDSIFANFKNNVFKNIVDMDDPDRIKTKDIEVYIDLEPKDKKYPEVVIQLKRNETLVKERNEIIEKNQNNTLFKNVIFIYLDALSRNTFRRKLPKTFKWLEKFYEVSDTEIVKNFSSYQFFKYHSLDYYTYANMIPGYFGEHKFENYSKYFLYDYKEAGYITGQSTNVCEREGWDLEMIFEKYLNYTNYDHEFNSFYCDPNFADPDQPYQIFKGAYSIIRKCLYGKDSGEFQIEYAKQFFEVYKDNNKIYRMIFSDAHEGTLEVVNYLDDHIHDFLEFLLKNNHLDNSVLLIMSDHGVSMPGPAYIFKYDDWFKEVFLPTLFYVIPKNHPNYSELDKNLKSNENKMVTSFDIHASLLNIVNNRNTKTKYGESLFSQTVEETYRNCEYYKIESDYCMCINIANSQIRNN